MKKFIFAILLTVFAAVQLNVIAGSNLKSFYLVPDAPWSTADTKLELPNRQHPFLFLSEADFSHLRKRAETEKWARDDGADLVANGDAALARMLEIPDEPGEWSHHYVCKVCGIRLNNRDGENVCPRCGRKYSGWPYDGVVAGRKHHQNINDAENLGLAYQFTGKEKYATRCREILLGYAVHYTKYPIHDYKGGKDRKGGRLFAQTLDESVFMIRMVWAYDLIYNSNAMTAEDRKKIEEGLFRPAALIIRRNNMTISNWQSWHNAALACIGFVLHDPIIVDYSINGKSGIKFQLKNCVLKDGFWHEGSVGYHFYALSALQYQAMAMKGAGMDIYKEPIFKLLYTAPLNYVFPDNRFPAVNDSESSKITSKAEFYEIAYDWYGDPAFAEIIKEAGLRRQRFGFLFGADQIKTEKTVEKSCENFPGIGATMMRQDADQDDAIAIHLDYGPHGGSHGHPDKLAIILFANGTDSMPDPGRLLYAALLQNKWYKTSLAHNTVIVDGKNQNPTEGKLISSDFDSPVKLVTAECDTAYKNVKLTRSVALGHEYLLDVVTGKSPNEHTWDLAYHVKGKPETNLILKPIHLTEETGGYKILTNVKGTRIGSGDGSDLRSGEWKIAFLGEVSKGKGQGKNRKSVTVMQAGGAERDVILADGLTGSNVTTCPVVLSRIKGKEAFWITLSVAGEAGLKDWNYRKTAGGGWEIEVKVNGGMDRFTVKDGRIYLGG